MEIIILGSSAAIPIKERNLPSIALNYGSEIILFDCGEDLQRKFTAAGLKFNKSLRIFITHFHGDHVIGLPGLLFRFGLNERSAPVNIFGPRNLQLYLLVHKNVLGLRPSYPVRVTEIDYENNKLLRYASLNSDTPYEEIEIQDNVIYEKNKYLVKYALVNHSIPTLGFSFIEKPRYGKFDPDKAKELGIPMSDLWKKLQTGEKIEFNGKIIDPEEEGIVGPKRPGRKITYSGDTGPCDALIELGKDSDVLIHESTFAKNLTDVAREKMHSTSEDAANAAKLMGAKQLILTHISSRYQEDASKLLEEAKKIFPNSILAEDLLKIELK